MKINLKKKDLIRLILGTVPHYGVFYHPLVEKCGRYIGGFAEEWIWESRELEKLKNEELYELYKICNDYSLNIPCKQKENKYPITEEQRKNAPKFSNGEDMLSWELVTQINNDIVGELLNK